jgi:hypothetical protein
MLTFEDLSCMLLAHAVKLRCGRMSRSIFTERPQGERAQAVWYLRGASDCSWVSFRASIPLAIGGTYEKDSHGDRERRQMTRSISWPLGSISLDCADDWKAVSTARTICWCPIAQQSDVEMSGPLFSSIYWSQDSRLNVYRLATARII